jgi:hypothetical protein
MSANIEPGSQSNGHPDILLSAAGQEIHAIPAPGTACTERKNKGLNSIFATDSRNGQLWISKSRIFVQ